MINLSPILFLVSAAFCFLNNRALANDGKFVTPAMPENPPATWLTYHLAHPGPGNAFPGDPNPAFFWKGRYHLHYIYKNHTGFVFAHVSSDDMVHWKWHPTVLGPTTMGHGIWSGTGFITKDGRPVPRLCLSLSGKRKGEGPEYSAKAKDLKK